jgi:hypothetical protein
LLSQGAIVFRLGNFATAQLLIESALLIQVGRRVTLATGEEELSDSEDD